LAEWGWVLVSGNDRSDHDRQSEDDGGVGSAIAVAGAHGGAGATTLATLLGADPDLGVVPRHSRDWVAVRVQGRPLVLVTRNTVTAAASATAAINAIESADGRVAVLAIVNDGMPTPKSAAYRFEALAPRVSGVVRIPFIAALRVADDLDGVVRPRPARRALAELRVLALAAAKAAGQSGSQERK
jgi:hypothetical protein